MTIGVQTSQGKILPSGRRADGEQWVRVITLLPGSGTAGDGEPTAGIRASDAERDATLERLSAATGDGRLTLEEFSQRMDRAFSLLGGTRIYREGPASQREGLAEGLQMDWRSRRRADRYEWRAQRRAERRSRRYR